jgi:aminodeoxyfutalosine synthase
MEVTSRAFDELEAHHLLESTDLIAIGVRADDVRRRMHGARTTFVRVFEVHVDAVPAVVPPRVIAGEFRIIGRPASVEAAVGAVRSVRALSGDVPVTGFTLTDLHALGGKSFTELCSALGDAGLYGLAEVAIDLLPSDGVGAIAAARQTGLQLTRLTVHSMAADGRIAAVAAARDLQNEAGGFRVFAPLPRTLSPTAPSTGYDDVKQVAIARLLAANIESIQVDWPLYGPKLAQVALTMGADDVDAIAAVDPGTLGIRRSPIEEIRGNIRAAVLEPVERNARFEAIG